MSTIPTDETTTTPETTAKEYTLEVETVEEDTVAPPRPELMVPEAVDGIQVNFCKNPACFNFSMPAEGIRRTGGGKARNAAPTTARYTTSGTSTPYLKCTSCGEFPPIKSNQGIKEELDRISAYLEPPESQHCSTAVCDNHINRVAVTRTNYRRFGKTAIGSPRWQCKLCGKTVSQALKAASGQKKSHLNVSIFLDLMNKTPLKAIARKNRISMTTVYNKINFIHSQCVAFASHRERELPNLKKKWMEISVDRQEHVVNWFETENKRNIRLHAIASVDNRSGYVFGSHVNYDQSLNLKVIEAELFETRDHKLPAPFRKYARLWLRTDFHMSALNSLGKLGKVQKKAKRLSIDKLVDAVYKDAAERTDVEAYDALDTTCRLPEWGMQVHAEYTLYAHFLFLKKQLAGVGRICFYLDQDSGIRGACLGAFADRVLNNECDAFYVMVGKELSQAEKLSLVKKWEWRRDEFAATHTGYEEAAERFVRRAIVEERLRAMTPHGKWKDKWLEHPFATMSEPEKMVCYLTSLKEGVFDYDERKMAAMFDRASLHYVDSFFMQSRRLISMFERPITSSSMWGQKWYGYSAYRPEMIVKLLEIFRVYHNYVIVTEGTKRKRLKLGQVKRKAGTVIKKSPAMRLGLAKGRVTEEDILYFVPKR